MPAPGRVLALALGASLVVGVTPAAVGATSATMAARESTATWSLDPEFSDDGVTSTPPGSPTQGDQAFDLAIQDDGKIVVVGTRRNYGTGEGEDQIMVARFRADGSLDPAFGGGVIRSGLDDHVAGFDLALQHIGGQQKIVVVGHIHQPSKPGPDHQMLVLRLNPDGTMDTDSDDDPAVHFDHDGIALVPFARGADAYAVAIDPENRILVAGRALRAGGRGLDPAVARLLPEDGALDPAFGGDGMVKFHPNGHTGGAYDVAIQPVGSSYRVVLAGAVGALRGVNWGISRLTLDGSVDTTFGGGDGHVSLSMRSPMVAQSFESAEQVVATADGSLVVVGESRFWPAEAASPTDTPAAVRLTPDGELDDSFSHNGKIRRLVRAPGGPPNRNAAGVVLSPDGTLHWVGSLESRTFGDDGVILVGGRRTDGRVNRAFGPSGYLTISIQPAADFGRTITFDLEGRLVVVAESKTGVHVQSTFGVARLTRE